MYGGSKNPVECPQPPQDTPSDLSWSWAGPQSHELLGASSWDGTVRAYQVQTQAALNNQPVGPTGGGLMGTTAIDPVPVIANIQPKALFNNASPTLSCLFVQETLFSGTCDKKVNMHNLTTNQTQQIGAHNMPIFKLFFDARRNLVGAVSWENQVKLWDTRSPNPAATINLPSMAILADASDDMLAIIGEDKKAYGIDLSNLTVNPAPLATDPLSFGPSCVACIPTSAGMVIGGNEGRCRFGHFTNKANDFNFRCHRLDSTRQEPLPTNSQASTTDVYGVSAIGFNPIYKTLMTGGHDGHVYTWDHQSRMKIHVLSPPGNSPITCAKFDISGRMLAVGCGYDWSQGINGRGTAAFKKTQPVQNKIVVVPLSDAWIRPKTKT